MKTKEGLIKNLKQFIKFLRNYMVKSHTHRVLAIAMIFSVFLPQTSYFDNAQSEIRTDLAINQSNPLIFDNNQKIVSIEVGRSNYDIANPPRVILASSAVAENTIHNDPKEFRPVYMAAAKQFNIPWQLIEAVHEVESGKSGSTDTNSYAGAQGPMQFMPGTWRGYAVDGNGDGQSDITDVTDAIYTGANYLAKSGADEGRIDDALFNYNHSTSYVEKVKTIAYEIGLPE